MITHFVGVMTYLLCDSAQYFKGQQLTGRRKDCFAVLPYMGPSANVNKLNLAYVVA